ncbi:hypothetical protein [Lentilactobacillus kisonensis]|uniref:Toxin-antitoxin system, toxin component, MazF family n=1 Tax=Lentilactobacillus kisonensis DSM 19906 = JCM 15041 TaxID=1423766 RepID=A0A0R1NYY0_9LACO|nr:hypothetical protein [Lentilactobacillus kisonensis]KRL22898.1 hypothetical protein FC98_GL001650 [Lentilactobacillus kisonensis DSM 19906 = JCM 15041]
MKIENTDIVYAYVRFSDKSGGKSRPVLIFQMPGYPLIAYKITSKYDNKPDYLKRVFYEIKHWQEAGLRKKSWVDTAFKIDMNRLQIVSIFGQLHIEDVIGLRDFINQL